MTDEFWDDINIPAAAVELGSAPASIPAAVAVSDKLLTRLKDATSAAAQPIEKQPIIEKQPVVKEPDGKENFFGPPVLPGIIKTSINVIDNTAKSFGMPPASGFFTAINIMSKSFDNFYSFLGSS